MRTPRTKQGFENYKLVLMFFYGDKPRHWINETNYANLFDEDWNEIMPFYAKLAEKTTELAEKLGIDAFNKFESEVEKIHTAFAMNNIKEVYANSLIILKWYNENA